MLLRMMLALLCLMKAVSATSHEARAANSANQFFVKAYTEGLGRVPDDKAFEILTTYFQANGCTPATIATVGRLVLLSQEFATDYGDDHGSRVMALYRVALNRDPDVGSYPTVVKALASGMPWDTLVATFFGSAEFTSLVQTRICVEAPSNRTGAYGWGGGDHFDRNSGTPVTRAALQKILDGTPSGQEVCLPPRTLVSLDWPLVVPAGVRLTTCGHVARNRYLQMARILRATQFPGASIWVMPGGILGYVWVDGNRSNFEKAGLQCPGGVQCPNISVFGGRNSRVVESRISDSYGWTNLAAYGSYEAAFNPAILPCDVSAPVVIANNLSTQYATSHFIGGSPVGPWADGLSIACEHTEVFGNQIVDGTDVGLILFASGVPQASHIYNNVVLNAGNAAFASLAVDTRFFDNNAQNPFSCTSLDPRSYDFSGATFQNNKIFTTSSTYVGIGISVGIQAWASGCTGTGVKIMGNNTGGHQLRTNVGVMIGGMDDASILGNTLLLQIGSYNTCSQQTTIDDPDTARRLKVDMAVTYASIALGCIGGDQK